MVRNRSEDEIVGAANLIDGVLDTYYDSVRGQVIIDLLQQYPDPNGILKKVSLDEHDMAELDRRQSDIEDILCGGRIPGIDLRVPNVPTRNDVPDFVSLKVVERYLAYQEGAFTNGSASEYFGVLALRYVEDTIESINHFGIVTSLDPENEEGTNSEGGTRPHSRSMVLAAQPFAYAIDTVSYGEHLAHLIRLGVSAINETRPIKELAADEARKLMSEMSKKGTDARHAENRHIAETIEAWYLTNHAGFKSLDAAAEYAHTKIARVSFRTARKHIGAAAKKLRAAGKK